MWTIAHREILCAPIDRLETRRDLSLPPYDLRERYTREFVWTYAGGTLICVVCQMDLERKTDARMKVVFRARWDVTPLGFICTFVRHAERKLTLLAFSSERPD